MTKMTFFRRMAFFACVALTMNIFLWSCSDKTDSPEDNKTEIKLKTPEEAATIDLASGDVTFSWEVLNGTIPGFTLFISKSVDLNDMALWSPVIDGKKVRKGGCGSFRPGFEYCIEGYLINMTYPATRKSIQIMNPAVH